MSHPLTVQPGYLSLTEAALYAGISVKTLKRWIPRGLPTYQAGPREKILIRPADIDQFLTRRQRQSPDLDILVDEVMREVNNSAA